MKTRGWVVALAGAVLVTAAPSWAERGSSPSVSTAPRGQGWSVLGGQSVGQDQNVFIASAGFPGVSIGFLHGVSQKVDFGLGLSFNYSLEGLTTLLVPGLRLQALSHFTLLDNGRLSLALTLRPGVFTYFFQTATNVGITVPVGLVLGIPVSDAMVVHAGMELPLYVTFGLGSSVTVPILFGGGLEYFLDRSLAVTLDVMMGPSVNSAISRAQFDFRALLGVALKL